MKGANFFLLASFSLAAALIFSCGEYAEIPYEQRIGSSSNDPNDPNEPNDPAQLIWDLTMRNTVPTGGYWFSNTDGVSKTNFNCASNFSCDWTDNKNGSVIFNLVPVDDEAAFAEIGFAWLAPPNAAPGVIGTHTGLCVEYSLSPGTATFKIKISAGDRFEFDDFKISLPKRSSVGKEFFNFNDFKQEGWVNAPKGTIAEAKNVSTGIRFSGELAAKTGSQPTTATLTIRSISWDSCN